MIFEDENGKAFLQLMRNIGIDPHLFTGVISAEENNKSNSDKLWNQMMEHFQQQKEANHKITLAPDKVEPKARQEAYVARPKNMQQQKCQISFDINAIAAAAGLWWIAIKKVNNGKTDDYTANIKYFNQAIVDYLGHVKVDGVAHDHTRTIFSQQYENALMDSIMGSLRAMNLVDVDIMPIMAECLTETIKAFCLYYLERSKTSHNLKLKINDIDAQQFYAEAHNWLAKKYKEKALNYKADINKDKDNEENDCRFADIEVNGLESAMIASGYPMATKIISPDKATDSQQDRAVTRAHKLASCHVAEGHDCFLKGIIVSCNVRAEQFWWQQFQRYHFADIVASQSKMHRILKFDLQQQCNSMVEPAIIKIVQDLINDYNADEKKDPKKFEKILCNLPMGFQLTARVVTNYLQLKTMYHQRKNHRLSMWNTEFVKFVKSLPMSELIINNKSEESVGD